MELLNSIFPSAVAYTIPLLLGALGALYSERSGVTNLCIEGFMLMGCFSCAVTMVNLQGNLPMNACFIIGLVVAVVAGAIFSILHAIAAINLKADQVISGTAINMLSTALTVYLAQTVTGSGNITIAHSVVPFSINEFLASAVHYLLWCYLLVFIVYMIVRQCFRFAHKGAAFDGLLGRAGMKWMLLAAAVVSLVLSFFISSALVVVVVADIVVVALFFVLRGKEELWKGPLKKVFADDKQVVNLIAALALNLISGLVCQAGAGSFLRTMAFTRVYWTTIVGVAIWLVSYFLLYKTSFGLRLRACGEHPSAVASAGINVHRMRYIGVIASGALAGLGGGVYLITVGGEFNSASGMNGLGFLAVAGLIFGQWKVLGILGSTFFFGFCYTIANMSRIVPALAIVPAGFLSAFPYVATLIVLVFTSKRNAGPLAAGQPY